MEKISAQIKKVEKVLVDNLVIPNYQRPYRWTEDNVRLLLEDVTQSWKEGKGSYRIGSVILNNDNTFLNVVDGQQRLTTILLILKALKSNVGESLRNTLVYKHQDSLNAIINNKKYIDNWLMENIGNETDNFTKYLLGHCEFVEVIVSDLSEAFQMFDSQNGRGKDLEAYNLLKAYHIRAMESNTFDEKIACDVNWENAARYQSDKNNNLVVDLLRQLINEQLYRTRVWSRKETALEFNKKKINEFKGVTIHKNNVTAFPYQNKELLQYIMQDYFKTLGVSVNGVKSRFNSSSPTNVNPFTLLNQNLVNGKSFFEYTETYIEIYKRLFHQEFEDMKFLKDFIGKQCQYNGSHRDGDQYLFELYKSLIMLMFDKFGETGIQKYYKTLYLLVYRLRIEKEQVRYASVAEYPVQNKVFHIIEKAKSFSDLSKLEKLAYQNVVCKKDVEPVIRYFQTEKVKLSSGDEKKVDSIKYNFV